MKYYSTAEVQRTDLPWYCSPLFWTTALIIVLVLAAKDFLLGPFPLLKKPLDALEVFENKASAIIAVPALIGMITGTFGGLFQAVGPETVLVSQGNVLASLNVATMDLSWLQAILLGLCILLCLLAFVVVWLVGHTINLLILLNPFGFIDFLLKGVKILLLLVIVGAALVNPYLGAIVSLLILYLAIRVAGWSFRLTVFGTLIAWDLLTLGYRRFEPECDTVLGFTCDRLGGLAKRSLGRIDRAEGDELGFSCRPWLIGRRREVTLPAGRYALRKGLITPVLQAQRAEGEGSSAVLTLLPRCKTHEEAVARLLGITDVQEPVARRSFQGAMEWLKGMLGRGSRAGGNEAGENQVA